MPRLELAHDGGHVLQAERDVLHPVAMLDAAQVEFIDLLRKVSDSIRKQVELRVKMAGLQDLVPQVLVPFERVTDMKGGKKRVVNKKLYPGYLMIQAVYLRFLLPVMGVIAVYFFMIRFFSFDLTFQ